MFKGRKEQLRNKLQGELDLSRLDKDYNVNRLIKVCEWYEDKNLKSIKKLSKSKRYDLNQIRGGLKQTINAHGPITKNLIQSATKRIYGALLSKKRRDSWNMFLTFLVGFSIGVLTLFFVIII